MIIWDPLNLLGLHVAGPYGSHSIFGFKSIEVINSRMELLVDLIIRLYLSVAGHMLRMHSTVITSRMELLILLAALEVKV